ncbi:DMT family transporter [Clostridium tunisiense]|uniref:DMT family transporter n=1 Tax=Clostridium tunisiense TaxID=219748 RepID=UPI0004752FA3|nr:DMT family transporter [Clostridium tunisiense]
MYGNLAVLNGILLAIMIFLNSVLSKKIGLYNSTLIHHIFGFILILIVSTVILRFIGQMLTSAIIDYWYFNIFSMGKVIGCILFLIGIILNAKSNEKYKQNQIKSLNN